MAGERPPRPAPPPSTSSSAPTASERPAAPPNVPPPPAAPSTPAGAEASSTPSPTATSTLQSGAGAGTRAPVPPPAPAPSSGERPPTPPPNVVLGPGERAPGIPPVEPAQVPVAADSFEIGFDAARVGKGEYTQNAIYVSRGREVRNPAQIGLKTVEKRPASASPLVAPTMVTETYNDEDTQFYHGSIEYWVAKKDFNSANKIIRTTKVPIVPVGVTRINHERLILSERTAANVFLPDTGFLMGYSDTSTSDIKVFRNGLQIGESEWEDVTEDLARVPNSGQPMRSRIRIKLPLTGDIFTVSYNPSFSTTVGVPDSLTEYSADGLSVVDLVGDLSARVVKDQIILFTNPDTETVKSLIYLIIVLRNNTGDQSITPAVEEYSLMIGERDPVRYSEDGF
jgi:hypothetical protein